MNNKILIGVLFTFIFFIGMVVSIKGTIFTSCYGICEDPYRGLLKRCYCQCTDGKCVSTGFKCPSCRCSSIPRCPSGYKRVGCSCEKIIKRIVVEASLPRTIPRDPSLWNEELNRIIPVVDKYDTEIIKTNPEYAYTVIKVWVKHYDKLVNSLRSMGYWVHDDILFKLSLDESVEVMGGPYTWGNPEHSLTGEDTLIAIIDTGIDEDHQDFGNRIWYKFDAFHPEVPYPDIPDLGAETGDGHGTHVASIAAGDGESSDEKYKGVAPNAKLAIARACHGACWPDRLSSSLHWINDDVDTQDDVDVIIMSLGFGGSVATEDACTGSSNAPANIKEIYDLIQDAIHVHGIVVVAVAGNEGPDSGTINFPGCIEDVIAVGSTTKDDVIAEMSSRGPAPQGIIKPDVVAPGVNICAAKPSNLPIVECTNTCGNSNYMSCSGTSMATPHVGGVVALLKEANPEATPEEIVQALLFQADNLGYDPNTQGYGRVNIPNAVDALSDCDGYISLDLRDRVIFGRLVTAKVIGEGCYYTTIEIKRDSCEGPFKCSCRIEKSDCECDFLVVDPLGSNIYYACARNGKQASTTMDVCAESSGGGGGGGKPPTPI